MTEEYSDKDEGVAFTKRRQAMARDPRKRQKQQERRAAKRKTKHHELTRHKHAGMAERLSEAAAYLVTYSWVSEEFWSQGIGSVSLARALPNGHVAFALFLVDRYCLGVKDIMADVIARSTYEDRFMRQMRQKSAVRDMPPAAVRKLVEEAVEYARRLGLHPHPDYAKARHIFGDINPADSAEVFEFGKDGKPFFVAGPYDGAERCRSILSALVQACGVNGFHYLLPMADPQRFLPQILREQNPRIIGPDATGATVDSTLDEFEKQHPSGPQSLPLER
jgi:hypothetical protein